MSGVGAGASVAFSGVVGAAKFDPDDIPNLVEDFNAQKGVTIQTGVSLWTGAKGNSVQQINVVRQPAWDGAQITFDGVNDFLSGGATFTAFNGLNQYTICVLGKSADTNKNQSILAMTDLTGIDHGILSEWNSGIVPNRIRFLHRNPYGGGGVDSDDVAHNTDFTSDFVGVILRRSGTRHGVIVDRETETYIAPTRPALVGPHYLTIGNTVRDASVSRYFKGPVRRILLYSRALTDSEAAKIVDFFNSLK
jgi:hypothetical protein